MLAALPLSHESEILFEIRTIDDLVAGMLAKPQYPHEVLAHGAAMPAVGIGFWERQAKAEQEAATANRDAAHWRQLADEARGEAERAMQLAARARQDADRAMQLVACARQEADRASQQTEFASARLAAIEASSSWRLTAPLRALVGRLRQHGRISRQRPPRR